jgi:hypothetical protein
VSRAKKGTLPVLPRGFWIDPNGVDVQPNNEWKLGNASLWERFSASRIPYQFPVAYESLCLLRSCAHRIRSLWKRGYILHAETGPVYQESSLPGHLVRNERTQARSHGIQKLLGEFPWLTTEDCRIYLAGWNTAEEWRDGLGTEDSSVGK